MGEDHDDNDNDDDNDKKEGGKQEGGEGGLRREDLYVGLEKKFGFVWSWECCALLVWRARFVIVSRMMEGN